MYGNYHTINSVHECVRPPLDGKDLLEMNGKLQQNIIIVGLADMLIMFMYNYHFLII